MNQSYLVARLLRALFILLGAYSVTVGGAFGSTTGAGAVRTLIAPPVIKVQPVSQTVAAGQTVKFSVTATGTNLNYQWLFNGVPIPGQINGSNLLTTVAGNASLGGGYSGDGGPALAAALSYPASVAADQAGNLYISDTFNNVIRKVDANGIITTFAGDNGRAGYSGDGGAATNAGLSLPSGIATDDSGNLYISDWNNNVIRKVDTRGIITTAAGNAGLGGGYSGDGGAATNAALDSPSGIAVDHAGDLYIADYHNNVVRRVDPNGVITTLAGNQQLGGGYSGDGGAATNAALNAPTIAVPDNAGHVYISDSANNVIRRVDSGGVITTFAGNQQSGGGHSGDGGAATNATLNLPEYMAFDQAGNLYIPEYYNHDVRQVEPGGLITTVAGNYALGGGYSGDGGAATNATLNNPVGVAVDGAGNLYIADAHNNVIRKVAGSNPNFSINGGTLTLTNVPFSLSGSYRVIVSNAAGSVTSSVVSLVVETPPVITNQPVSQIIGQGGGVTFTVGAYGTAPLKYQWSFNGAKLNGATSSTLTLTGVPMSRAGNYQVTVANAYGLATTSIATLTVIMAPVVTLSPPNATVTNGVNVSFNVTAASGVLNYQWLFNGAPLGSSDIITTVAGNSSLGGGDSGDGGPALAAAFNYPDVLVFDPAGNLYVSDVFNSVVRKVDVRGIITTVAGNNRLGAGYSGDGGAATNATLNAPEGIALDRFGNLYIAEFYNDVVRKVDVAGVITTVAGNASLGGGYSGDGGAATNAALDNPSGLAADDAGNLYVADYHNNVIRKVATNGLITTVAGNFSRGGTWSGDGGAATNAGLSAPAGVLVDAGGNIYVTDTGNNVIRRVDAGGIITTIAGNYGLGAGYSGDGGAAINATLDGPNNLALDQAGNLYIPEYYNNVVRKVDPGGVITTFAGNYDQGGTYSGDGGAATNAGLNNPVGTAVDRAGNLYIADAHNNVIRKVTPAAGANPGNGTLSLSDVQAAMTGNYQVVVTYAAGSVTSSVVKLVVLTPPMITAEPVGQTVNEGGGATLSVSATGTPPLIYQWTLNGARLSGATNSSLVLTNVHPWQAGDYAVKITTPGGAITSSPAVLTVVTQTFVIYNFSGQERYYAGSQSLAYSFSGELIYLPGAPNGILIGWGVVNGKKQYWNELFMPGTRYTIAGAAGQSYTVLGQTGQTADGEGNPYLWSAIYQGPNSQLTIGSRQYYSFPGTFTGAETDVYTDPDTGSLVFSGSTSTYTFAAQTTQTANNAGQTLFDLTNGLIKSLQAQGYQLQGN